jgi:hypothetical protein
MDATDWFAGQVVISQKCLDIVIQYVRDGRESLSGEEFVLQLEADVTGLPAGYSTTIKCPGPVAIKVISRRTSSC